MANEIELFKNVINSNIPQEDKSKFRRILDKMSGGQVSRFMESSGEKITGDHMKAAGNLARDGGEGLAVGAGLGYLDAKLGGLDVAKIPLDLVGVAAPASLISVMCGSHPIGTEFRNVASSALTVYGYRNMKEFTQKKQAAAIAHGEPAEDPILKVGKTIKGT